MSVSGEGDALRMVADGKSFGMHRTISASGARYEADGDPTTIFWNRGNEAMVTVAGETYPTCYSVDTETGEARMKQLTGAEWVVEDIEGRGIVDSSRVTMTFTPDGKIGGRGLCNSYGGNFTLTATGIVFGKNVTATMMACEPALMEQERRFFDALAAVQSFEIAPDGALVLSGLGGKSITARR